MFVKLGRRNLLILKHHDRPLKRPGPEFSRSLSAKAGWVSPQEKTFSSPLKGVGPCVIIMGVSLYFVPNCRLRPHGILFTLKQTSADDSPQVVEWIEKTGNRPVYQGLSCRGLESVIRRDQGHLLFR